MLYFFGKVLAKVLPKTLLKFSGYKRHKGRVFFYLLVFFLVSGSIRTNALAADPPLYTVQTLDPEVVKNLRIPEFNGLAYVLCQFAYLFKYAFICMLWFFAYQRGFDAIFKGGSVFSFSALLCFIGGVVFLTAPEGITSLIFRNSDISFGCECKPYIITGSVQKGNSFTYTIVPSGLTKDCQDTLYNQTNF